MQKTLGLVVLFSVLLMACDKSATRFAFTPQADVLVPNDASEKEIAAPVHPRELGCFGGNGFQSPEGILDKSFNGTGMLTGDYFNGDARPVKAVLSPDCKLTVLVAQTWSSPWKYGIIQFNLDGTLNKNFGSEGVVTFPITNCALGVASQTGSLMYTAEGKLVAVTCSANQIEIRRYSALGELDIRFGGAFSNGGVVTTGGAEYLIEQEAILDSQGRIVVVGHYGNSNYGARQFIARYSENGVLDYSFGVGGIQITTIGQNTGRFVAEKSDGTYLVLGSTDAGPGDVTVANYQIDGYLNTGFGKNGLVQLDGDDIDIGTGLHLDGKGNILVGMVANTKTFIVTRLTTNGQLDTSYASGTGILRLESATDYLYPYYGNAKSVFLANGDLILTTFNVNYTMSSMKANADGTEGAFGTTRELITNFGSSTGYANAPLALPDGRFFVLTGLGSGAVYHTAIALYR